MDVETAISDEIPSSRHEKKKRKRKDAVNSVEENQDCPEGTSSMKDTPLGPTVKICTNAVPTNTETTMSEPTTNVGSEKKKKKKKSKASDDVLDNECISLENSSLVKDTQQELPADICTVVDPTEAEPTTLEPPASVASEKKKKKKKSKITDGFKMVADHESASVENNASLMDTPQEPPVMVPTKTEATAIEPPANVTSEKKKKSKITDDLVNADHENASVENNASVEETPQEALVNIGTVEVPTEAEAATLERPTGVTSEKKKKKKKSKIADDLMNADHENASVMDTFQEPLVDIGMVEVPTKAEATTLDPHTSVTSEKKKKTKKSKADAMMSDPTNVTSEKKKRKERSKIDSDFEMDSIDHESAPLENSAWVKDTPLELPVNISVPTEMEEATMLEPLTFVNSEKKKNKKKSKASSDSKMDAVDQVSASLENSASAKDNRAVLLVNFSMISVPTEVEATVLEPPSNVASEKKKKKKRRKTRNDSEMNRIDQESASLENSASATDTPLVPLVNLSMVAVPPVAETEALGPPTNVALGKKRKKRKKRRSKTRDNTEMNAIDHESAALENSTPRRRSHPESAVVIGTVTNSERWPSDSVVGNELVTPLVNLSTVAVLPVAEAEALEPPTNVASKKKGKKRKKREKRKSKTRDNTEMNAIDHESASLENSTSRRRSHPESAVVIGTVTNSERRPSDSVVGNELVTPLVNLSTVAVPPVAEAEALEPPTNVASEKKGKKRKKREKRKSKRRDNTEMNAIDHESASLENSTSRRRSHPESAVVIGTVTNSERRPSDSVVGNELVTPLVNLSTVAVPPVAEAEALEPPTNVASVKKGKKRKKREKRKSKTRDNTEMNAIDHESASLENSTSRRRSHPESAVVIGTVTNSERRPSDSVVGNELVTTTEKKKKRKRSRSKDPTTNNTDHENLNGATLEPAAVGREQQIHEIPHPSCNELTTNLEKPTPNLDLSCSEEKVEEMNRETIRKQKNEEMGQNDNENNNKVLDGTVQPSLKLSVGIEPEVEPLYARSSISHEMGEKDEKKFSVLEIDDTAHALQQNVGTPSQGDFVAEVAGLISTGVNETCPTSEEQSGLSNGVDNGLIKKRGGYTEVCDVPESREVETSKWRKKSHHTNGKKFSDLGDISQPVEDKVDNDTSSPCLVVENTSVSLDNKFEKTCSRIGVVSEQVTDILTEKDSDNHLDNSSDILKLDSVKIDITREEAPPSTNNGQVEDLVHLDATVNKGDSSQMPNTLPERSLVVRSKKKLLILDVNGILVEFVSQVPRQYRPHIRISKKGVFKRPYCDDFLQFCFERFNVAVWSSRMKINVDKVVNFLFDQTRDKLLFCWDQSHCTPTGLNTLENNSKPLVLKELRKVWEKVEPDLPFERGEYDETNTLLLDDSPYKALRNPANTAVFPFPYRFENRRDNSLGPGGDLRTYLEGLSMADNVKEYVEQNPFGQGAITKLHKQWNFYCNIVAAADEPVAAK